MSDAQFEKTTAKIEISTNKETLTASGEVMKFDGFLKVYLEGKDDDEIEEEDENTEAILPPLSKGQVLDFVSMTGLERFSRAASRYTEASLVKKVRGRGEVLPERPEHRGFQFPGNQEEKAGVPYSDACSRGVRCDGRRGYRHQHVHIDTGGRRISAPGGGTRQLCRRNCGRQTGDCQRDRSGTFKGGSRQPWVTVGRMFWL